MQRNKVIYLVQGFGFSLVSLFQTEWIYVLFASIDRDGGFVFSFISTRRPANCVIGLTPGNSLRNTFPTSICYLSSVPPMCVWRLTLILNWWTQGTELKYAANVHWSCLFPRWPSCPRVIPDVHVSLERVDAHVSKGLIVWRKWRVNRWTVFILTPKETNPSDKKASV